MEEYKTIAVSANNKSTYCRSKFLEESRQQMKIYKYISRGTQKDCEKLREWFFMSPSA